MPQGGKNIVIELLKRDHDRSRFECGVDALDNYIKKQARQDVKRRISRVFVATDLNEPNIINGYYTLSSLSIELTSLPISLARKLPKHPVPAALIGRLAVSQIKQGQGMGKMLLADAIKRTLSISNEMAIYALVVDAINNEAERFYEQFGFIRFSVNNPRLFLPLKSFG
ncbi:hypothetical protein MNBD_GAMMA21-1498 [hydrothermal vent metagenome]|uniref:N-acetyltransferase domain-containing protein n=1 Tax=hydrothermal vent metagenome TaxID=652676 RepID=A0A3B0ZQ59_9ZZZZ